MIRANVTQGCTDLENISAWCVYILEFTEGRLYTGITTDIERRIAEHEGLNNKGAKALRGKGPLTLRYLRKVENRSIASRIESEIKKMTKQQKSELIAEHGSR